jgi:hypothetical protein
MSDITPRKTTRTIIIACVIATAFLYFIVYPTILYINSQRRQSVNHKQIENATWRF